MKEKESDRKKTVVLDVSLIRELVVILCCILSTVAVLAYLMGESAAASSGEASREPSLAQSTGMRRYYLTQSKFLGNQTLTACASGYHFASLWEIIDPSNLKYDTSLGAVSGDSGQGPPTGIVGLESNAQGWVRTGYSTNNSETRGRTNCNLWTGGTSEENGTVVRLLSDWASGGQHIGVWTVWWAACNNDLRVWCVED